MSEVTKELNTRIIQRDDVDAAVLHKVCRAVQPEEIGKAEFVKILEQMKAALASQADGVAIAAPQIGVPLRIFIVSKKVFVTDQADEKELAATPDRVFINPEIIKTSRRKVMLDEGCLSVRFWYGYVERAQQATVRALDEHGHSFTLGGSGLLAQIFQHETDHLNGILFIDKAEDLEEADPEEINPA
jgi:peptide deformylase